MIWFLFLIANISLGEEITGKDSTKLRGCIELIKEALDQELIELEDRTLISTDDFYELFQNEVALNCYEKISKEEARLILRGEASLEEFLWLIKLSNQEVRHLFIIRLLVSMTFADVSWITSQLLSLHLVSHYRYAYEYRGPGLA